MVVGVHAAAAVRSLLSQTQTPSYLPQPSRKYHPTPPINVYEQGQAHPTLSAHGPITRFFETRFHRTMLLWPGLKQSR